MSISDAAVDVRRGSDAERGKPAVSTGLTASCGAFAAHFGMHADDASDAAYAIARVGIVDAIGVMLAARNESVVRAAAAVALDGSPAGSSSVLLSGQRARAVDAAFVNATAAHAFAMDDVALSCHPSALLMPALLAEAESLGASGSRVLRAYVTGFEILAELDAREPDALHTTGWHPSGLLGPVAVAAAVGNLKGLSAEQCTHAIGIAASMTGGLQANFGTQTKALHAGRIASAGVLAARLAAQGVTSSPEALEQPKGLLRTISPKGRAEVDGCIAYRPGRPRIVDIGLSIKKYPVCYSTHRLVDAAIDLAERHDLHPDRIARIDVRTGRRQAGMARHAVPRTGLEARYSVAFAVVSGLVARAAGFRQITQPFIESPIVRRLLTVTFIELSDEQSDDDPVFAPSDRIRVTLDDGRSLDSGAVRFARGHATLPLGDADLRSKFMDCAAHGGYGDADALYDRLATLATIPDMRSLAEP
jgi:2-methylcitrate dehydratase PrpD